MIASKLQRIKLNVNNIRAYHQYMEICKDVIKSSSAKLDKTFEKLLLEILLLYMVIQDKIRLVLEKGKNMFLQSASIFNRKSLVWFRDSERG
ncbi:hypothetical protein BFS16_09685 [Hoylesella timonensis]|uniref:Uncharacterized protein n=1 Tax=Hoylesella timonensis TaxID=386414 RepID=A0A2K0XF86_9BACT|nr:hypothetical protein BFS16_09685 [Hoylesella timonensis]